MSIAVCIFFICCQRYEAPMADTICGPSCNFKIAFIHCDFLIFIFDTVDL